MAIDLNTNWTLIHEQSLYRTNTKLRVYAKVKSQDVANNSSVVATWMGIYISDSYTYSTSSCTGHVSGASDFSYSNKTFPGNAETYLSGGEFTAGHNADGTGRTYCTWWLSQTFGGSVSYTESTWLNLPTIPRASQPSINTWPGNSPNITAGTACTIHMNRASTSFTHKVTYSIGSASGTIANSGVTDNVSWTPPTSLCAQFPNATSKSGTITVTTYNGSTEIGSKSCTFNLSIPSNSNPTLSSQSVTEQNSKVSAKGSSITIQQISSKKVSVVPSAKYSASISKVVCNGVTLANSGGTYSTILTNLSTGTFTFTVTDSRGLTGSMTVNTTYYSYSKPQITSGSLTRTEQTSSTGSLNVGGTYSTILSNTVTMKYERKVNGNSEGSSSVTPTLASGKVSYSKSYTDLYYTNSYQVNITITDSFGEVTSATINLGQGQYALWLGKTGAKISGDLTVGGTIYNNGLTGVLRRVAEGLFDNEMALYSDSNNTPHRFRTCNVYDDTYFRKVHDSDNWEYLVCKKSCRYVIVASTCWENYDEVQMCRFSITANSSGTFSWDYQFGETCVTKYTIHFGFTRTPYINSGSIIKWCAGANHKILVYNVNVQIFAFE